MASPKVLLLLRSRNWRPSRTSPLGALRHLRSPPPAGHRRLILSRRIPCSPHFCPGFRLLPVLLPGLTSNSAAARAEHLQDGIRQLEQQLRSEVLSRHDELLSQLSSLRDAESALSTVRSGVSSLQSSLRRVRLEISDPRRQLQSHTLQLSNLHHTANLLQSTFKLLRQSRRLRDLMATGLEHPERLDLAKAAEMHREIELIHEECGLKGISAVDEEMKWLSEIGIKLRSEAMRAVERGMEESNPNDIWCGLQVFYNLGELRSTVDALSVSTALDMKAISASTAGGSGPGGVQRSGTPQIGSGKRAGEALWERMGKSMEELHKVVTAVWQLQTVLSRKRVPFTHVSFLHEVWEEGSPLLTDRVWEAVMKSFARQMESAFTASSFVKEVLTNGYPKLFSMVENLLERILRDTNVKGVLPALSPEGREQMVNAIGRLSAYVNNIFPMNSRGTIPSKDQISRIVSLIQEEIEAVRFHGPLMLLVLHEVNKVLLLLAERVEYQISAGAEARQVTGPATAAQLKNFALCHHLQEVHAGVSAATADLPAAAADVLSPSLGTIYGVAGESVAPLFQAMLDRLESSILKIHDQDFELQRSAAHLRAEFLSRLRGDSLCAALVRRMAVRVLVFFVRHAALVRPLSEAGKLRLARDMAELELAVGQNLLPVEQLGAPYRALRALRRLIFLDTALLAGSPLLQELPASAVLHHLYSRRSDLTPLQYSLWMDSHGEEQIWKGVKATVDGYLAGAGEDPVCALMLRVGAEMAAHDGARPRSNLGR
ncbi:unnamed protein product [Spirodela intermedia]|uniref:Conserved oligomeric Golgi complex subunit 5 n=1 Tax=Spirodela intermedia TaxID=51605 RepID=A0A7I8IFS5_SPIIN|nr:unnamed protein product [Spirodela intermedia]CAA6656559.1 unnamed protein product [Spirodela intermedia]